MKKINIQARINEALKVIRTSVLGLRSVLEGITRVVSPWTIIHSPGGVMVGVDHVVDGTAIGSHDHVLPVKLGTNHLVQQVVVGARRYSV